MSKKERKTCCDKLKPWSYEHLSKYYNYTDLSDKKVLTITSTMDHALHAILAGAKTVDCFDRNKLSKFLGELKVSSIKSFDFDNFMILSSELSNDLKLGNTNIEYLTENMSNYSKEFWLSMSKNGNIEKINNMFQKGEYIVPARKHIVYFDEDNYELLKNNINSTNINFYDLNLRNIDRLKQNEYDAIFISNIMDSYSEEKRKYYLDKLGKLISDDGVIFDYHKYETNEINKTDSLICEKIIKTTSPVYRNIYSENVQVYKKTLEK